MTTLLVFPPAAEVGHPPLGIASLTGFLKASGHDALQLDLNVRSYHELLSERHLARCGRRLRARIRQLETRPRLRAFEAEEYSRIVRASLSEGFLKDRLVGSLARLGTPDAYASRRGYRETASVIRRGMEFVAASHHPAKWTPGGYQASYEPTRSLEVLRAVSDRRQNIFLPCLERSVAEVASIKPRLVGISINYHAQLIAGMTLASLLRRFLPGAFIVVGGSLIGYFDENWEALGPFARLVDGFIPFEGELPLLRLVQALEAGRPTSAVPGLVRFDRGRASYVPAEPPPDVGALPLPDFSGLALDAYLSPARLLPVLTTRGCYWGRCAFCTHDHVYRGRYRPKAARQVRAELDALSRRYGVSHFYFVDESLPPAAVGELARAISERGLPYRWFGDLRFERTLDRAWFEHVRRGGCTHLILGLESAVDRVLAAMDKGTDRAAISRILRTCRDCGITTFVMFIVGFPGETAADVEETVEFLAQHEDCISHAAFGRFILEKKSAVHAQPGRFAVRLLSPDPADDLAVHTPFTVASGLSSAAAAALVEEIEKRPPVERLAELRAVCRTHVAFLPPREAPGSVPETRPPPPGQRVEDLHPVLAEGCVAVTLPFDLCRIDEWLASADLARLARGIGSRPTNYVFLPRTGKLVEVGPDGLLLLAQCDGRRDLRTVLSSLTGWDRRKAMRFYVDASQEGCLVWRTPADEGNGGEFSRRRRGPSSAGVLPRGSRGGRRTT
jgi:anaerobic magnesium-protoporphyrin IX monomethyl ester cyclase